MKPIELDNSTRRILGLMTGTSADGLDLCLVEFNSDSGMINFNVLFSAEAPYPKLFKTIFSNPLKLTDSDISNYDIQLGKWLAATIAKYKLRFDAIASHGQTIKHEPPHRSLQIGDPRFMADKFRVPVIYDFRTADIEAGGQGAPLIPIVDQLLFQQPAKDRLALNIGGIANLSIIPARNNHKPLLAWDTGPGNTLIDKAVRIYSRGALDYDRNGQLAKQGHLNQELLDLLLKDEFYSIKGPKSAGQEQFGEAYLNSVLDKFKPENEQDHLDLILTLTFLTAHTIGMAIKSVSSDYSAQEVFISGGGCFNDTLISLLKQELPDKNFRSVHQEGVTVANKEAFGFAYLGYRRLQGLPGNIPSVTGARESVLLGKICSPA